MLNISTIILAAGKGTRLKSDLPKVLHKIKDKPSLFHIIDLAKKVSDEIITVIGYKREVVQKEVELNYKNIIFAIQEPQNGTAHAVSVAIPYITKEYVLILSGDVPMLRYETLQKLIDSAENFDVSFIAAYIDNPSGYGRVILDDKNTPIKIVEDLNCDEIQKNIKLINSGIYLFNKSFLTENLFKVKSDNKKGEFYLPDLIAEGYKNNSSFVCILEKSSEILGFNTTEQLELLNN